MPVPPPSFYHDDYEADKKRDRRNTKHRLRELAKESYGDDD
jgi:hypothetical protein